MIYRDSHFILTIINVNWLQIDIFNTENHQNGVGKLELSMTKDIKSCIQKATQFGSYYQMMFNANHWLNRTLNAR